MREPEDTPISLKELLGVQIAANSKRLDVVTETLDRHRLIQTEIAMKVAALETATGMHSIQMVSSATGLREQVASTALAMNSALASELRSQKEAVLKAEIATEHRFESVNAFREQMADLQETLMPRGETESMLRALDNKLDIHTSEAAGKMELMRLDISTMRAAKVGAFEGWGWAVGVIGLVVTVISIGVLVFGALRH